MFTKEEIKKLLAVSLIVIIGIIAYHLFDNFTNTLEFFSTLKDVISPIVVGFVIAYILNIPMKSVERIIFEKRKMAPGLKRALSFLITLIVGVLFFVIVFSIAIPQLIESIDLLMSQLPDVADNIAKIANEQLLRFNIDDDVITQLQTYWEEFMTSILAVVSSIASTALSYVSNFISGVFNAILSSVLAIYILMSKEKLVKTFKKLIYAFTSERFNKPAMKYLKMVDNSFEQFIRGQLIEAVVLGILCYIGMLIFGFEYALLISVIVGMTNVIPLFGPYIGAIPSVFLLLTINPIDALLFIVYLIVLQQLESNIIYPRVVGGSVGLSGFWILVAVIIGNSLFGIPGILLGIPLFSTFYKIISEISQQRLKTKKIRID